MPDKHPYVTSPGSLDKVLKHLRKSFPRIVTAETLKKLGFAPKNESYVINVLKFLKIIEDDGLQNTDALKIFTLHEDKSFHNAFASLIQSSYPDLFELYKDEAWSLDDSKLIPFFRQNDQSTEVVGKLQARTFRVLAENSGHNSSGLRLDKPAPASRKGSRARKVPEARLDVVGSEQQLSARETTKPSQSDESKEKQRVVLTVRVEVNLPAQGDQETYDRIFRSIRENLLNGE